MLDSKLENCKVGKLQCCKVEIQAHFALVFDKLLVNSFPDLFATSHISTLR